MANSGIKYPVHISVPIDKDIGEWLTVKCNNESQLRQALIDSKANSDLFKRLGIGDTAVDFEKLQKAREGEYKNPPPSLENDESYMMEEFAECNNIEQLRNSRTANDLVKEVFKNNVKYKGKSKHYYNRQINDVCSHNNHISSNCDDCFDEQIYQQLAIDRFNKPMKWLKMMYNKLKQAIIDYKNRRDEEQAYNDYMSRR